LGTILENVGFGHNSAADWLILAKLCAKTQNPSVWPSNVRQNSENSRWRAELHQNLRYERICYTIYCLNGVSSSPSSTIGVIHLLLLLIDIAVVAPQIPAWCER